MDIKDMKDNILKKAYEYGFEESEIYYNSGSGFRVKVFQGEIDEFKNTSYCGLGFRGVADGRMGYAYTETIDDEAVEFLLKNAKENAALIENTDERIYKGDSDYEEMPKISEKLEKITTEEKIQFAKAMEEEAFKADKRINAVEGAVVASSTSNTYIANSYGLELYSEAGYATAYVEVTAKEGDDIKVNYEVWQERDFEGFDPKEVSRKAVEKCVKTLGAKPVESKNYNVLFNNEAALELFSVYLGSFFAENVQKGFSLLGGKIGEKIANSKVNIYDNICHEKSLTPLAFDSEGVKVRDKILVEAGVLKTYLYNYKASLKEGVPPTGNGFKGSYKGSVGTACANCYIGEGEHSFDELVNKLDYGLIITSLSGLHSGCNGISGDFSLLAEGFLVEHGKEIMPVEQITIAGNFFELLKNIEDLGNDLKFEPMGVGGSLGLPSVLVSNISVSGV